MRCGHRPIDSQLQHFSMRRIDSYEACPLRSIPYLMSTSIKTGKFRVKEGKEVTLKHWPTRVEPFYKSKEHYVEMLQEHVNELSRLQSILYADRHYAVLLIIQAMDTAGKDGVIQHVLTGLNPQGCEVWSFKQPSVEELGHDFLWRAARRLPERGRLGVFNRSYYEEVLVVRVHPDWLGKQRLPEELAELPALWKRRYQSIVHFERHLHQNGTRVIKIYLHLSKGEQRKRLLSRIDEPEKNWKFEAGDLQERQCWKQYMKAYEDCLSATSTQEAPWYVVPADDKPNARLVVSQILLETLSSLKISYPEVSPEQRRQLQQSRRLLLRS